MGLAEVESFQFTAYGIRFTLAIVYRKLNTKNRTEIRLLIRFRFCTFSLFAQSVPQTFTTAKSPADAGFSADRLKRLDTWLQDLIDKDIAPNVVTLVAHKGKVVHYKAFGYSNLEQKNTAETR